MYDLSKAARDMRTQLASSLEQAQTAQIRHKYGSLKESMRKSRFLVRDTLNLRGCHTDAHQRSLTSYQSRVRFLGTIGYSGGVSVCFNLSSSWSCTGKLAQLVRVAQSDLVLIACQKSMRGTSSLLRTSTLSTLISTCIPLNPSSSTTLTYFHFSVGHPWIHL